MGGNWVCPGEPQKACVLLCHPAFRPSAHPLLEGRALIPFAYLTCPGPATTNDLVLAQTPDPASCWADWDRIGSPNQEARPRWAWASQVRVVT